MMGGFGGREFFFGHGGQVERLVVRGAGVAPHQVVGVFGRELVLARTPGFGTARASKCVEFVVVLEVVVV